MSMDEQFAEMQRFTQELTSFNEHLQASLADLQHQHETVDPLWQDEMRRRYDLVYGPFQEKMKHYLSSEARNYIEFLHVKTHALRRYLQGG